MWKPQVSDQSRRLGEYVSSKDRVIIDNTPSSVRLGRLAIYRYVYVRVVGYSHSYYRRPRTLCTSEYLGIQIAATGYPSSQITQTKKFTIRCVRVVGPPYNK